MWGLSIAPRSPEESPSFETSLLSKLVDLNETAKQLIENDYPEEALEHLQEAENLITNVETMATEEEVYVLTIFYNIACCH